MDEAGIDMYPQSANPPTLDPDPNLEVRAFMLMLG